MIRAAIYARFSTNLQADRSIDDQITLCRAFAINHEYEVVKVYSDAAKSGASMHNRDGIRTLMADAMEGHFDVVIVEALDRLSRDMEDLAGISKRLKFQGIDLVGVHDGKANTVTVGLRGLVGQLYREDNANKVRRGLAGRVKQGLSGGGQAYGYRPDPMHKGKMLIVEEEAEVIRRIFEEYASGKSPRHIAYGLNHDGIAPPRGTKWNASTINGSAQRGNGILHNALYSGVRVWNRVTMIKDPDTGRRLSRPNPESEWERVEVPELKIVSDDLWKIAQTHRRERVDHEGAAKMRRPKRLLSGLLKCGCCGSGMSTSGADKSGKVRLRCSAARESGTCPDPKTFYAEKVEHLVVGSLLERLAEPEILQEYVKAYHEEMRRLTANQENERGKLAAELERAKKQMHAIVMNLANEIVDPEDVREELATLRQRKRTLEEELSMVPESPKVVTLLPSAVLSYQEAIRGLYKAMKAGMVDPTSKEADFVRELIQTVHVYRSDDASKIEIEVAGHLTALLTEETRANSSVRIGGSGGRI